MTHNSAQTSYSYDSNNKLTQFVGPGGTTTFGYDGNGNTTTMTAPGPITTTYGYDYENRLTTVTKPGYTAGYTYSADGLRLRAQESNNPNPDRWFQYDGVRPVLESLLDGQGNLQTILAKYVWEGNSYHDPLVLAYMGSAWRHPLYDGLGSTRQIINQTDQAVTDTYSYEAFGNLLSSTGSTPNPYKYVGSLGYYATGLPSLLHLGARYYMAEIGRLTSSDALYVQRRYSYTGNRAPNRLDPSGLSVIAPPRPVPVPVPPPTAPPSVSPAPGIGRIVCKVLPILGMLLEICFLADPAGPTREDLRQQCWGQYLECTQAVQDKICKKEGQRRAEHYSYCTDCYALCLSNADHGSELPWPHDLEKCQYWSYPWTD